MTTDSTGEFLLKSLKEGSALVKLSKKSYIFGEAMERKVSGLKASWGEMQATGVVNRVRVETYQESYDSIVLLVERDGQEVQNINTPQDTYDISMMAGSQYSISALLVAQGQALVLKQSVIPVTVYAP